MKPLSASHKNLRSLDSTSSLVVIMSQDHPLPFPETCYNNCAVSISRLPSQLVHNPFQTYEIASSKRTVGCKCPEHHNENEGLSVQTVWLGFWKSIRATPSNGRLYATKQTKPKALEHWLLEKQCQLVMLISWSMSQLKLLPSSLLMYVKKLFQRNFGWETSELQSFYTYFGNPSDAKTSVKQTWSRLCVTVSRKIF